MHTRATPNYTYAGVTASVGTGYRPDHTFDMLNRVLTVLLLSLTGGCAATVYPVATPVQPTAVYLADYGIHSSVLLPAGDGRYVEYAFGDWNFAALNHCGPQDAVGALLVSFQSTLGRRFIPVQPGQAAPHPVHPTPHRVQLVYASRTDVERLVRELDERYRRGAGDRRFNPDNDMDYVKDREHYWIANNCNHLTARCLREMGCDVRGLTMLSSFDVAPVQKELVTEPIRAAAVPATMPAARTGRSSAIITAQEQAGPAVPERGVPRSAASVAEKAESPPDRQSSPLQRPAGPATQAYRPPELGTSAE